MTLGPQTELMSQQLAVLSPTCIHFWNTKSNSAKLKFTAHHFYAIIYDCNNSLWLPQKIIIARTGAPTADEVVPNQKQQQKFLAPANQQKD